MTTPSWRDFERAGWQQRAAAYDRFFAPVCAAVAPTVLAAVSARPGSRLLDACCGPVYLAGAAIEAGCAVAGGAVVGIDIAPAMIALAAERYPSGRFIACDVGRLPCRDASFDAVVCNLGIHHVTDPSQAIAEFARVLTVGGRLALTVWDDERSALGVVKEAILAVAPVAPPDLPEPPPRPDYANIDQVAELLSAEGFTLHRFSPVMVSSQRFSSAEALWDGWLPTAIRTAPLFAAQPVEVQRAARAAFDEGVAPFTRPDGSVSLPAALHLAAATR